MEDKRLREKLYMPDQELTFTKEDRNKVFEHIHNMKDPQKNSFASIYKKLAPISVSLAVAGLCAFLFISSNPPVNTAKENPPRSAGTSLVQEDGFSTALFMLKDENDRIPVNLLLSYNKDKKRMKIISIPRDTYAPIWRDGETAYDKLTFAYAGGPEGAEMARETVSELFGLPIDHYAVMELDTLSAMVDSVNGIEYDLQEDIKVRAISRVSFELKKGTNHLNGEEAAALIMAATAGKLAGEDHITQLLSAMIHKIKNEIPTPQLKAFMSEIEADITIDQAAVQGIESSSMESLSLNEGMKAESIDGRFYLMFEEDFLHSVSEELTAF